MMGRSARSFPPVGGLNVYITGAHLQGIKNHEGVPAGYACVGSPLAGPPSGLPTHVPSGRAGSKGNPHH